MRCIFDSLAPVSYTHLDTDAHIELAKRIFEFAHILGTELIRVFSFYLPKGEGLEPHRGAVIERMGKMLDAADEAGVILCHENESSIYEMCIRDRPCAVRRITICNLGALDRIYRGSLLARRKGTEQIRARALEEVEN